MLAGVLPCEAAASRRSRSSCASWIPPRTAALMSRSAVAGRQLRISGCGGAAAARRDAPHTRPDAEHVQERARRRAAAAEFAPRAARPGWRRRLWVTRKPARSTLGPRRAPLAQAPQSAMPPIKSVNSSTSSSGSVEDECAVKLQSVFRGRTVRKRRASTLAMPGPTQQGSGADESSIDFQVEGLVLSLWRQRRESGHIAKVRSSSSPWRRRRARSTCTSSTCRSSCT